MNLLEHLRIDNNYWANQILKIIKIIKKNRIAYLKYLQEYDPQSQFMKLMSDDIKSIYVNDMIRNFKIHINLRKQNNEFVQGGINADNIPVMSFESLLNSFYSQYEHTFVKPLNKSGYFHISLDRIQVKINVSGIYRSESQMGKLNN